MVKNLQWCLSSLSVPGAGLYELGGPRTVRARLGWRGRIFFTEGPVAGLEGQA